MQTLLDSTLRPLWDPLFFFTILDESNERWREGLHLSLLSLLALGYELKGDYAEADWCYRDAVHTWPKNILIRHQMIRNWARMNQRNNRYCSKE